MEHFGLNSPSFVFSSIFLVTEQHFLELFVFWQTSNYAAHIITTTELL